MENLVVKEVNVLGDTIIAAQDANGKIWAGVRWFCEGVGLSEGQKLRQITNIQEDIVLSKGVANLTLPTNGGVQEVLCLELDFIPLWLAKISITPNMKENNPDLVDKLVDYQLKAKDILAEAFFHKNKEKIQPTLSEITESAKFISSTWQNAGVDPIYVAVSVKEVYKQFGYDIPLHIEMKEKRYYDQTQIAAELGIMSMSGKPHSQAVGAIISSLHLSESDKISTPYTNHGHSGVVAQYTYAVLEKVREWLQDNSYPDVIRDKNKGYKVAYV